MLTRPHLNQQVGVVVHICDPSNAGSVSRRIIVPDWPWGKTQDLISKIAKVKKGYEHGSSIRVPA
jgi:hypothetical protein